MAFKAVFLDLGGVIIQIDWARPFEFVGVHDPRRRDELIAAAQGWTHFHLFECGEISSDEFYASLNDWSGLKHSRDTWFQAWMSLIVGPLPDVDLIFDCLKGVVPIYALTNTNVDHMNYELEKYPVMKRFDAIFASHEMGCRKPDVEMYLQAARRAGVEPNEVLFVDDSEANVLAARRAGFTAARTVNSVNETLEFLTEHLPQLPR